MNTGVGGKEETGERTFGLSDEVPGLCVDKEGSGRGFDCTRRTIRSKVS